MIKKSIITLSVLSVMAVSSVFAQLPKRVAAYNYMNSGEFDKAKEAIDEASAHPKTIVDYKTWYYKGTIYLNIAMNKNFQSFDADASQKSLEAYSKTLTLNFKDIQYQNLDILNKKEDFQKFKTLQNDKTVRFTDDIAYEDIMTEKFTMLLNVIVEKGVIEYEAKNYSKALDFFEKAIFITDITDKKNLLVYYNAALASEKSNSFENADKYYDELIKGEYGATNIEKSGMYKLAAEVKLAQKDTIEYVQLLKQGINKYPNECSVILTELINFYLNKKEINTALNYLKLAIEKEPKNQTYYFAQGSLFENANKPDSAEISYKKALEIEPNNFEFNYYTGVLYFNNAASFINSANEQKDDSKYNELKKKSELEFVKAQPYLEKALELNAKDINTMQSLKTLYYRLGLTEKYDAMDAKLKQ